MKKSTLIRNRRIDMEIAKNNLPQNAIDLRKIIDNEKRKGCNKNYSL